MFSTNQRQRTLCKTCLLYYDKHRITDAFASILIETFSSAQISNKGDICSGDSGGGLVMYSRQGRWVLVGVTSFGIGSRCDNVYYSMFTDVGLFYDWIEERVKTAEEEIEFSTI